jgi:(p)ppGpp synthase/HD superfamily hydrolase
MPHHHRLFAENGSDGYPPRAPMGPLLGERLTHILRDSGHDAPGQVLLTSMIEEVLTSARAALPSDAVSGRVKQLTSALEKAERMSPQARRVLDAIGVRVLVDDLVQCYQVIDTLHRQFRHVEAEYDDYIARPKSNGYRSPHTTVFGPENHIVELEVRTRATHGAAANGAAANGTAAHRLYKCPHDPEGRHDPEQRKSGPFLRVSARGT